MKNTSLQFLTFFDKSRVSRHPKMKFNALLSVIICSANSSHFMIVYEVC